MTRTPAPTPPSPARRAVRGAGALGLPLLLAVAVTAAAPGFRTVLRGDTLSELAAEHDLSVAELQRLNALGSATRIYAGQDLRVAAPGEARTGAVTGTAGRHRIAPGDTLSEVARRYGVSQSALAAANGLTASSTIYAGDDLVVPGLDGEAGPPSDPATDRRGRTASDVAASRERLAAQPGVSRAAVRDLIHDAAHRHGVDASLALAIAHQESGFRQDVVSPANAIGVMQVLVPTAEWMSRVAGRTLDPYDVRDNVEAGVLLLRVLRSQASVEDSIAGYYQGLKAVREHGWYAETETYVASVRSLQARYS